MKTAIALLLSALILSNAVMAQTSDQMPEKQGEWQKMPGSEAVPSANADQPAWMQYNSPYSSKRADLGVSHMGAQEISAWTQEAVSDVLSFSPEDYTERLTGFKKYFVASGWQGYAAYLGENGLPDLVKGQKYSLNAIVRDPPRIVKEGSVGGTYRWLVKASAVLSLSRQNAEGQSQTIPATTRNINVLVQLVRVPENSGGPAGLAVENWSTADAVATTDGPARPDVTR